MTRLYAILATMCAAILGVAYLIQGHEAGEEQARLLERIALKDSVVQVTETARAELAREAKDAKDLAKGLDGELADALKRLKLKPASSISTTIHARPETVTVALADTIALQDDSLVVAWSFDVRRGRYRASGAVYPASRALTLAISQDPIPVRALMTQTRAGNWLAIVDVPDTTLTVGRIESVVLPYRPGWWARNRFRVGLVLGCAAVLAVQHYR